MIFKEYVAWSVGRAFIESPDLGTQCVASVVDCHHRVYGVVKDYAIGVAKNFYYKYNSIPTLKNNFDWILPQDLMPGDTVIWDKIADDAGHCAILIEHLTEGRFRVLQQDGYSNLNDKGIPAGVAHYAEWDYTDVLGGLRHKSVNTQKPTAPEAAQATLKPEQVYEPIKMPENKPRIIESPKKPMFESIRKFFNRKKIKEAAKYDGLTGVALAAAKAKDATDKWLAGKSSDAYTRVAKVIGSPQLFHEVYSKAVMDIEIKWPWIHEYFHDTIVGSENTIIGLLSLGVLWVVGLIYKRHVKGNPDANPIIKWLTTTIAGTKAQANRKLKKENADKDVEIERLKEANGQ